MSIDRYLNTEIVRDSVTKRRTYATTIFPSIPLSEGDFFIITRDGDRLDDLANKFYDDSTLWWILAVSNNLCESFYIPPGTKLRIPADVQFAMSHTQIINEER
jgi:nucleoid-associated protein YgaU